MKTTYIVMFTIIAITSTNQIILSSKVFRKRVKINKKMKRNNVQNKLKTIQNRIAELNDDLELVQTNTSEEIWKQHIIETITHDINILQQQQDKFALVAKRLTKKNEEDSSTEKFLEESDDRIFFS